MQPNPRRNLEPLLDESALLRTAPRTFVLPEEWGPLESFMRAGAGDDAGPPTVIVKPKGRQQGQAQGQGRAHGDPTGYINYIIIQRAHCENI